MCYNDMDSLWKQYQIKKDKEIKETLCNYYTPLVKHVVGRLMSRLPSTVEYDDLVGDGIVGLIEAIERFSLKREVKFETYATSRIRGAILDALREQDFFSRSLRKEARNLENVYSWLENKLGRPATEKEVAKELGLSSDEFHKLIRRVSSFTLLSLDELGRMEEGKSSFLGEMVEDQKSPDPAALLEYKEMKKILTKALDELPKQERLVMALYYYEELTLKEISKVLGVSESRVCQIHTQAVLKLRSKLGRRREEL